MPKQTQLEDNSLETLPGVGEATKLKLNNIGIKRITDPVSYTHLTLPTIALV